MKPTVNCLLADGPRTLTTLAIGRPVLRTFFAALLFIAAASFGVSAQSSLEYFSTSMASIPNGPTTGAQSARLLLNTNNPAGNTIGATNTNISVTATLSNQQFTGVGTGTGLPVVMFGATINNSGSTAVAQPVFGPLNTIGSPANTNYSNTPAGTAQGMDVAVNQAFDFFTSVRQWTGGGGNPGVTARVRMADLTLTFSSPVTNPLLHLSGIGGTSSTLGFSTELTLTSAGLTLTKVQGNSDLTVTATQINNTNTANIDAACTSNAACGTIRVNGSNITTITFQVFVKGDGGGATWSTTANHAGDQWLLGVSLPEAYSVSGNVFLDSNGLSDNTVNGTGINNPSGAQLYANIVDPTDGTVVGAVAVAADGSYSLTGLPAGVNYRIDLSTNQGTPLAAAPARALPSPWFNVGENLGAGAGSDGTPDGALTVALASANLTNANFGIVVLSAAGVSVTGRVLTSDGAGIRNCIVTLTESDGTVHTALTGSFGYYSFNDVQAGQTVVLHVTAKKYVFAIPAMVLSLEDNWNGADFIAVGK